jgi:THO complex subunit 1
MRVPAVDKWLSNVKVEMDPDEDVEEEYKRKNDKVYAWRALRLLAHQDIKVFSKSKGDLEEAVRLLCPEMAKVGLPHDPPAADAAATPVVGGEAEAATKVEAAAKPM